MADHSDFSNNRTNINDFLDGTTFDNDVNKSLVENAFNRFLTKDETIETVGTIGEKDEFAALDRQIKEDNPHRQAFQLQPLVHRKVATIENTLSFEDMLNALERMGVDVSKVDEWADTEQFNFVPPVDLDKIINYRDYYWYDPLLESISPQYIVMQTPCAAATAMLSQKKRDLGSIGENLPLTGINIFDREFIVSNKVEALFIPGSTFDVVGVPDLEGLYTVESVRYVDGKTYIKPIEEIKNAMFNGATINFQSTIAILTGNMNSACGTSPGWDAKSWDDAPVKNTTDTHPDAVVPLTFLYDLNNGLIKVIAKQNPEYFDSVEISPEGEVLSIGNPIAPGVKPIWEWLNSNRPEFNHSWDGEGERIVLNQWQHDNKWVHKLDLPAGAISQSIRAEVPIIEYLNHIQLNEWYQVNHQWMYRDDPLRERFELTDKIPTWEDYQSPTFVDHWIYVGTTDTNPISPREVNPQATVMGMDVNESSTSALPVQAFAPDPNVVDVNEDEKKITIKGNCNFSELINRLYFIADEQIVPIELNRYKQKTDENGTEFEMSGDDVSVPNNWTTLYVPNSLKYDSILFPAVKRQVALSGTNAPRLYVDEIQQNGTFNEISHFVDGYHYVGGLTLNRELTSEQAVYVGIDPAAASDSRNSIWSVRTPDQQDDKQYEADGKPVTKVSMLEFYKHTQTKLTGEQKYPLFDLYYTDGESAKRASPLVTYVIDSNARVNQYTGLRLKTSKAETVYYIEQHLIQKDSGALWCYKDNSTVTEDYPSGLQTIWRTNPDSIYVPRFVDANRRPNGEVYYDADGNQQVANVDESNGSWEIINQWHYNASHETRSQLSTTELTEHILTLLRSQPTVTGYVPSNYNFRLYEKLDYALGGTIKEHNGSIDTLISSIFSDVGDPIGVLNFAATAYKTAISSIEDYILNNIVEVLQEKNASVIADLSHQVIEKAIEFYENNENNNLIFGDSTTFVDGVGIKNWPATTAFMGLSVPTHPVIIEHDGQTVIRHHDGHYDFYVVDNADTTAISRQLLSNTYEYGLLRVKRRHAWSNGFAADFGTVENSYSNIEWNRLAPGDIWISNNGWKRFAVISTLAAPPITGVPKGTFWLRGTDGQLMIIDDGQWVEHDSAPGDVSDAWKDLNLTDLLVSTVYEIETRLYEASIALKARQKLQDDLYIRKPNDVFVYNQYLEDQFLQYSREHNIVAPFASIYKTTDPFTWNYSDVEYDIKDPGGVEGLNAWNPFTDHRSLENMWSGYWMGLYFKIYGTPYPHREPWILQGFDTKPTWWDTEYRDTTEQRYWKASMWNHVVQNRVPVEYSTGNQPILTTATINGRQYKILQQKFNFVPVAITRDIMDSAGTIIYRRDDLLPPYDSRLLIGINQDISNSASMGKSIIRTMLAMQDIDVRKAYSYGELSPVEWQWRGSIDYFFDKTKVAFRMQPIRTMEDIWGIDFNVVGSLKINKDTHKVYSHLDTVFHGDVVDGKVYQSNGLNQWYVNYNRYSGLDFKVSNFREMWTKWEMKLGYQFGCFINTRSFDAAAIGYDLIKEDRTIVTKKTKAFDYIDANGLQVSVGNFGKYVTRNGTKIPAGDGHDWEFIVDVPSVINEVTTYEVEYFTFKTKDLATGTFELTSGNEVPWETGDELTISTTQYAPYPLDPSWTYYVSVGDDKTEFRLHRLKSNAFADSPTVIRTEGTGTHTIGRVKTRFAVTTNDSVSRWQHYNVIKKAQTHQLPVIVRGVQGLINFIDGYSAKLRDDGVIVAHNSITQRDSDTGRLLSWQTEIERCINKIYTGIGLNNSNIKQYGATFGYTIEDIDNQNNTFKLTHTPITPFKLGAEVFVFTSGMAPDGIHLNTPYYIIPVGEDEFKLATTPENAYNYQSVSVNTIGVGDQFIGQFNNGRQGLLDSHVEVNPFRNNLWIKTKQGMMSDLYERQSSARQGSIYDQYGRPLGYGSITVLRQDQLTRINVKSNLLNDINPSDTSEYNNLHIGGGRFYLDGFEHVALFNNYTTDGYLVYDPFIGLDITRLSVSFNRSEHKNMRPTIGGYYTDGDQMIRNLEATTSDMRIFYDQLGGTATSSFVDLARELLGYEDPTYLNQVHIQDRAKFMFWKGMIQQKGSRNAVSAFINSRQFVDAKLDEFWAFKLGDFGDARPKYKPEFHVSAKDMFGADLRYEFIQHEGDPSDNRYQQIYPDDTDRWINLHRIRQEIGTEPLNFEATKVTFPAEVIKSETTEYVVAWKRVDNPLIMYQDEQGLKKIVDVSDPEFKVNDRVFKLPPGTYPSTVQVQGLEPAISKIDPIELIDTLSSTTVATTKSWDPINGQHYYAPLKDVDYMTEHDPVNYESEVAWSNDNVGMVWVDTSTFGYVPYDDTTIYPNFNERMAKWGRLAEWANPTVYEWVRSTVHPSEYAKLASQQETDFNIPVKRRASGTPKEIHFDSLGNLVDLSPVHEVINVTETFNAIKQNSQYAGTILQVYRNGIRTFTGPLDTTQLDSITTNYTDGDYITFAFVPSDEHVVGYEYIETIESDEFGNETPVYFYWVKDRAIAESGRLPPATIAQLLAYPNTPYHIYTNLNSVPDPEQLGEYDCAYYNKLTVRGITERIIDNRYVLRLTHDYTLRDNLNKGETALDLKNLHSEWKLFRREQPFKVERVLWEKLTEALCGYELASFDKEHKRPIPSLSLRLYDEQHNTTTRFGFGPDQAFVDRDTGLATIQRLLETPDFSTAPIDKYVFLEKYTLDTPVNIKNTLEYIFANFSNESVNSIFFEIMYDALAGKRDYTGLFMTSFIALHGIKVLQTPGKIVDQ